MSPDPFPAAHFATFPRELPFRCLSVGTGEAGVCPRCGTPRVRVVARAPNRKGINGGGHREVLRGGALGPRDRELGRTETLGWRPGCGCDAGDPVPCTVLDPFSGAGTTALVAAQLGCRAVGVDLSAEYAEMARRRIKADVGSLGYASVGVDVVV